MRSEAEKTNVWLMKRWHHFYFLFLSLFDSRLTRFPHRLHTLANDRSFCLVWKSFLFTKRNKNQRKDCEWQKGRRNKKQYLETQPHLGARNRMCHCTLQLGSSMKHTFSHWTINAADCFDSCSSLLLTVTQTDGQTSHSAIWFGTFTSVTICDTSDAIQFNLSSGNMQTEL